MNSQLYIAAATPINTQGRAIDLAVGEIGVFAMDEATGQSVKATIGMTANSFAVAIGRQPGIGAEISRTVTLPTISQDFKWIKMPYQAPVIEIKSVYIDCVGLSIYDDFALRVSTRFGGDFSGTEVQVKTYTATGMYQTQRSIYDAWSALVNEDPYADVNVIATDGGLLVMGKTADQVVDVSATFYDGQTQEACAQCQNCSIIVTTENQSNLGSGTPEHLRDLVRKWNIYRGAAYNSDREIPIPSDFVSVADGTTWDLYWLEYKNADQPKGDHGQVFDLYQRIVVAFPAGTNADAYESVITSLVARPIHITIA